jgi:hypothetical protein
MLDIDALHRASALHAGKISSWACQWLVVKIEASADWITIDGDQRVELARDEILNGRYTRTKFLCSNCNRGCRVLHAQGCTWFCRLCASYDYISRHRNRWATGLGRLQSLRRRIALGHPLHAWSKRRLRRTMLALEGDVAESVHDFVVRLRSNDGRHDRRRRDNAADASSQRAADRLERFREDDAALAELAEVVHKRAMAEGENANAAGHLDLKVRERRAMWGYDSPIRFDMVMMEASEKPSGHDQMMATFQRFFDQRQRRRPCVRGWGRRRPRPRSNCSGLRK